MINAVGFKLVCIDDSDPMEYQVLDDINKKNMYEVYQYVEDNAERYPATSKLLLLPIY